MNIAQRSMERGKPFYSFEFFPPREQEQWPAFYATVEKLLPLDPLFASVTYGAGGSSQTATLDIVAGLKEKFDLEAMAHLTCVGATREHIKKILAELRSHGITNVLALRGDLPTTPSVEGSIADFTHAADLVRFVRDTYPDMGIGVAGYPAPHPESPSFASDWRYTVAKIREGADFVITQLFFDVREYFNFVDRLSDMGVSVPVIPGILPIQSLESIRRTLSLCGATIPGKFYLQLEEAYQKGGNAAVKEVGIAFAVQQIKTLLDRGAPGIHLYTLNNAATCLRIADEVGPLSA